MLYCYFGHHKAASTWLIQISHDICSQLGLTVLEKQICLIKDIDAEINQQKFNYYISNEGG